jgi:hypothetical protein
VIKVSRDAASAIAGDSRFAPVRVEDARSEVCIIVPRPRDKYNSISARAIVALAHLPRKFPRRAQRAYVINLDDQKVIAHPFKLCEIDFAHLTSHNKLLRI